MRNVYLFVFMLIIYYFLHVFVLIRRSNLVPSIERVFSSEKITSTLMHGHQILGVRQVYTQIFKCAGNCVFLWNLMSKSTFLVKFDVYVHNPDYCVLLMF